MEKKRFRDFNMDNEFKNEIDLGKMLFMNNSDLGFSGIYEKYDPLYVNAAMSSIFSYMERNIEKLIKGNDGLQFTTGKSKAEKENINEFIEQAVYAGRNILLGDSINIPSYFYEQFGFGDIPVSKNMVAECIIDIYPRAVIEASVYLVNNNIVKVNDQFSNEESNKVVAVAATASALLSSHLSEVYFEHCVKFFDKDYIKDPKANEDVEFNDMKSIIDGASKLICDTGVVDGKCQPIISLFKVLSRKSMLNHDNSDEKIWYLARDIEANISMDSIGNKFDNLVNMHFAKNKDLSNEGNFDM